MGTDGDEPLFQGSGIGYGVNVNDVDVDVHHHRQRLRVDSIIFDPTSFLMGGVHKTLALLLLRYEPVSLLASPGEGKDIVDDTVVIGIPRDDRGIRRPKQQQCYHLSYLLPSDCHDPSSLKSSGYNAAHLPPAMQRAAVEVASASTGQRIFPSPRGGG